MSSLPRKAIAAAMSASWATRRSGACSAARRCGELADRRLFGEAMEVHAQ
ncbi:hypothetical protein QTQ03_06555 [Micromonospora sp. WMMA1363]|nr:hypothetical protein [Micromonospora sp. WMMA1363]MDM4719276.1 hypothetical protein [Micromonospora sp. WMMA1363]